MTMRRSWQHMAGSVVLCAAIIVWYLRRGASIGAITGIVAIGAFLVAYDVVRIAHARAALREPSLLKPFAERQRRSHQVRGSSYLVGAPTITAVTWAGALTLGSRVPKDEWAVVVAGTLFLSVGWIWWLRIVRRLATDRLGRS